MPNETFTLHRDHPAFPQMLRDIPNPPEFIHGWGDHTLLNMPSIAIIGTRFPTDVARQQAFDLAAALAQAGYVIVAGLAYGIDIAAHRGALSVGGRTIAVLSTPLEIGQIYPATHRAYAMDIVQKGGLLISEYDTPSHNMFKKRLFLRDRLQSGLSIMVIPVQWRIGSGTRHTIDSALEQGRHVLIPMPRTEDYAENPDAYAGNDEAVSQGIRMFGAKKLQQIIDAYDREYTPYIVPVAPQEQCLLGDIS